MADKHLNVCKDCVRKRVKTRYFNLSKDSEWIDKERERGREKYHRLHYHEKYGNRTPLGKVFNIPRSLRVMGYDTKNKEAHHWNYNEPRSVFLISRSAHSRIHTHLKVNHTDKYCYTDSGERLLTENQAKEYFKYVLSLYDIDEPLEIIHVSNQIYKHNESKIRETQP